MENELKSNGMFIKEFFTFTIPIGNLDAPDENHHHIKPVNEMEKSVLIASLSISDDL